MNVIGEILKWSEKLPDWQSDALRLIWINGQLTKDDEKKALDLLLLQHGLLSAKDCPHKAERFSSSHIASATVHGQDTVLKSLHTVKNVNALRGEQKLEFANTGVTVIYGDNATGKSGYSRVLKRACRARGATERIFPNVYAGKKASVNPAEASFDVSIDKQGDQTVSWKDGSQSPSCLANIAVFDSKVARVHVDEANEVVYVPYGLDVFTKLATLCRFLREELQKRLSAIPLPPAVLVEVVGEGKPVRSITAETETKDISAAAVFTDDDQSQLTASAKKVADYKANDPLKKAEGLRRQKVRVDRLREAIINLRRVLSDKSVDLAKKAYIDFDDAQKAADLASKKAFDAEPLSGTGSNAWKVMFEAAKRFSEESAYPGQHFPVISDKSRCLLCQQELGVDGKARLDRFWKFIELDVAKKVDSTRAALEGAKKELQKIEADPLRGDPQFIEEIREKSNISAKGVESFIASATKRLAALQNAATDGSWNTIPSLADYSGAEMSKLSKQLESEAKIAEQLSKPEEQASSEKKLADLTIRKKLRDNKQTLLDHHKSLLTKKKLNECLGAVGTTGITKKQSDLMEQALTGELESALRREFGSLGIGHLPLKLNRSGTLGSTYHKLSLPEDAVAESGLAEILSEGEYRVVAIASFLAELSTANHQCGIVFDDPVSSLDQKWRERVARRLVLEGKNRQIVIFTHDIVFLVALRAEAAIQGIPLATQMVTRTVDEVGIINPHLSTPIMNTGDRLGTLKQMHQAIKAFHRKSTEEEYRPRVLEFYGSLRNAWERAVEEHLFGDVVFRFRPGVETQKLSGVSVEDQDVIDISNGMTRCSKWIEGHDQPGGAGSSVPQPDELENDLKALEDFRNRLVQRAKDVAKGRKSKQATVATKS